MDGKKSHFVRSLTLQKQEDYAMIPQLELNCPNLSQLVLGFKSIEYHENSGVIWDGSKSINEFQHTQPSRDDLADEDDESDEEIEQFELNVEQIASNLRNLKSLQINSGLQMLRQPVAPPILDQLPELIELRLSPITPDILCDTSRDERNLRILAQSSKKLTKLDVRGCYLKIFSLGWLSTETLEALHVYYQVPAASVLHKWSRTVKYLTLARVSEEYKAFRCQGPAQPGEELDACITMLSSIDDCPLEQLDLQESDCSLDPLISIVKNLKNLHYLDTQLCKKLPSCYRKRIVSRSQLLDLFSFES